MEAVILAAGYATRLRPLTADYPKPLLPVGGIVILDRLLDRLDPIPALRAATVVTNHRFIEHFRLWHRDRAAAHRLPVRLLDDGTVDNADRLGAVGDLNLALRQIAPDEDIFAMAADNLPRFELGELVACLERHGESCIATYREPDPDLRRRTAVLEFDAGLRVIRFAEKPANPDGIWVCPPFYAYHRAVRPLVQTYLDRGENPDAPGHLVQWLHRQVPVRALPVEHGAWDIGSLDTYHEVDRAFGGTGRVEAGDLPYRWPSPV